MLLIRTWAYVLTLLLFAACSESTPNTPNKNEEISGTKFDNYFTLLDTYPITLGPLGNASQQEIEIIRDPVKMQEISTKTGRTVGIMAQDKYWIWLNDAVQFPGGQYGVYGRLIWQSSLTGTPGIAVLAIMPDGRIALNRNYRHATRSWEFELPRGCVEKNETPEAAAVREVKEETGLNVDKVYLLGKIAPDTGLTNTVANLYLANVVSQQDAQPENSEAIAGINSFSVNELKLGFVNGYLTVDVDGHSKQIPLRDPFLAYAFLQAELRNLLPVAQVDK